MTNFDIINRRAIIAGIANGAIPKLSFAAPKSKERFFVGTYAFKDSQGLINFELSAQNGLISRTQPEIQNLSFGIFNPHHKIHYFLNESENSGLVGAYRVENGLFKKIAIYDTQGGAPCHIAINQNATRLAIANYVGGNVIHFEIDAKTGELKNPPIFKNEGKGPNLARQDAPHAHWVGFHNDWLYSVDLGTDEVLKYRLDAKPSQISAPIPAFKAKAGNGPRHLAIHPKLKRAYLVNELASSLTTLEMLENGDFIEKTTISSLPPQYAEKNYPAHIEINSAGTRLYFSNRGANEILVFAIDKSGDLALLQRVSTLGNWPRFFKLLESQQKLVVLNQKSGEIVSFKVEKGGTLSTPKIIAQTGAPVFFSLL